jgi:hypothetical protein
MFRVKYRQRNIQKRIVVTLALLCLMACAVDMQLYLEHQIAVNIVTHTISCHMPNQHESYFNMSIYELMDVVVISQSDVRSSFLLLNLHYYLPESGSRTRLT